jgi:DNA repair protein RadC
MHKNLETKRLCIKDWSEEDRPREKLLAKGVSALGNAEIIAILLGSGTRTETAVEVAQRVLYSCKNNLTELGRKSVIDLCKINGIGPAKAITVVAAIELGRRKTAELPLDRAQISSSADVTKIFQPLLADLQHEEFWLLLLDRANKVITKQRISQGGISGTVTDIRIVMKNAIDVLASGIVVVHNHPSGNRQPSESDKYITSKIEQATNIFDIKLLDHIIVTNYKCFSFSDDGLL